MVERPAAKAALAAVVVAVVAAGAGAFTRAHYAAKGGHTTDVLALQPADVRQVVVTSNGRRVELTRGGDGGWAGAAGVPPSTQTLMLSSEEELFPLRAFRAVTSDAADPQFGLVDPEITLEVNDAGGRAHQVAFGAATFTDGGFYAKVSADSHRLYLVPKRAVYDLRSMLAGHRIDPPNDVPQKVRDLNAKTKENDERSKVGYWLQQSLDSGTPVPEELK